MEENVTPEDSDDDNVKVMFIDNAEKEALKQFARIEVELKEKTKMLRPTINNENAEEKFTETRQIFETFKRESQEIIDKFKDDTDPFTSQGNFVVDMESYRALTDLTRKAEVSSGILSSQKALEEVQNALAMSDRRPAVAITSGVKEPAVAITSGVKEPVVATEVKQSRSSSLPKYAQKFNEGRSRSLVGKPSGRGGNGSNSHTKKRKHNLKKPWPTRSSRKPNGKGRKTRSRPRN